MHQLLSQVIVGDAEKLGGKPLLIVLSVQSSEAQHQRVSPAVSLTDLSYC